MHIYILYSAFGKTLHIPNRITAISTNAVEQKDVEFKEQ